MPAQTMALNEGDTVLNLLIRTGVDVKYRGSGMTAYVESINGLAEKIYEYNKGGWIYEINGVLIGKSCGVIQPKNGDVIVWKYTL